MDNHKQISILIAEDHLLFSEGLRTLLQSVPHFHQIHQARNGAEAVEMARAEQPDIILMDIQMPEVNGLEAAKIIKQNQPHCRIIMLTSFTDEHSVKQALSAGVEGYCSKEIDPKRLIHVIEMVSSGSIYLDPSAANFVLQHYFTENDLAPAPMPPLAERRPFPELHLAGGHVAPCDSAPHHHGASVPITKSFMPHAEKVEPFTGHVLKGRELEILALVANGNSYEEIADTLKISIDWVNAYIKGILQKLAVDNEWEAVKKAIADGAIKKMKAAV